MGRAEGQLRCRTCSYVDVDGVDVDGAYYMANYLSLKSKSETEGRKKVRRLTNDATTTILVPFI